MSAGPRSPAGSSELSPVPSTPRTPTPEDPVTDVDAPRRSKRIKANKTVESRKGTTGMPASRVSLVYNSTDFTPDSHEIDNSAPRLVRPKVPRGVVLKLQKWWSPDYGSKRKDKMSDPYPHIFRQGSSSRENMVRIILEPIAIITIHLQRWHLFETPAVMAYQSIITFFHQHVVLIEIDYNFTNKTTINNFVNRLNKLLDEFKPGQRLERFRKFCIFVSTHSDPSTGDLHLGPEPRHGAAPIKDVLEIMFPPAFQKLLQVHEKNLLNIMACGAVANVTESNQAIQEFSTKKLFTHIYAFTQADFQPALSFPFCEKLVNAFLVFDRFSIHGILQDSQSLGAHTGIMEFKASGGPPNHYQWSHASKSPLGNRISPQCVCGRMDSIKVTSGITKIQIEENTFKSVYEIKHRCKARTCQKVTIFSFPDNASWVGGNPPAKGPQGGWFVTPWSLQDNNAMETN
ncbi:hypothetical protein HYPSUDRAFT_1066647 [Hypholoma sublateritium FD-334 SS-4]|uniref:Uncharacterized protein n=1 Tax=Hypholoma sublateritium (strain FD-334 SS-4) TaxID=945553 RepID=A0A0D2P644_HYPSF|nr:hypothetical protein HYPSUDRAFT_1066647 [Hypholoma sublateritium FD-334 SS-4]